MKNKLYLCLITILAMILFRNITFAQYSVKSSSFSTSGRAVTGSSYASVIVAGQSSPPGFIAISETDIFSGFIPVMNNTLVDVSDEDGLIPKEFRLEQNYPNPFNPNTKIKYAIPEASLVSIIIYDILGRKVLELENSEKAHGYYTIDFNASRLASGVYIYAIKAGKFVSNKKMLLLK